MSDYRLLSFLTAILDHGWTTWANTACGQGGVGGQALTTECHEAVIQHLVTSALMGWTLVEAADDWERAYPGTVRLDVSAKTPYRRGPDGRPV